MKNRPFVGNTKYLDSDILEKFVQVCKDTLFSVFNFCRKIKLFIGNTYGGLIFLGVPHFCNDFDPKLCCTHSSSPDISEHSRFGTCLRYSPGCVK